VLGVAPPAIVLPYLPKPKRATRRCSPPSSTDRGMVYLLARNEVPVEELVGGYLRNRGLVR
jgi:hypothetical protein